MMLHMLMSVALVLAAARGGSFMSGFVAEEVQGVKDSVKWASDPVGLALKVQRDIEEMQKCPDLSKLPQKEYTMEELAKCNGKDGQPLLLVITERVYNFTMMADLHPAGGEPLQRHAGHDATAAFAACGITPETQDLLLHRFRVGSLKRSRKRRSVYCNMEAGPISIPAV